MGLTLVMTILRGLKLPNLKTGTAWLSLLFFFDIFWCTARVLTAAVLPMGHTCKRRVFISPFIFKRSVMCDRRAALLRALTPPAGSPWRRAAGPLQSRFPSC